MTPIRAHIYGREVTIIQFVILDDQVYAVAIDVGRLLVLPADQFHPLVPNNPND